MQVEVRYLPPHRREGGTSKNVARERPNAARATTPQRIFSQTNLITQPGVYEGGFFFQWRPGGIMQPPVGINGSRERQVQQVPQVLQQVQQVPRQLFVQPAAIPDLGPIREAVSELYRPGLRKIGRPKFYKPYPKMIDKENPYPRRYKILDFSLFSGEDGQSTLKHVARFTIQCGELANYENFYHFKLRLFPNSLIWVAFTWYTTLLRKSIQSWQEIER